MNKSYRSYAEEWLRRNVGGAGWKRLVPSLTKLLESVAQPEEKGGDEPPKEVRCDAPR